MKQQKPVYEFSAPWYFTIKQIALLLKTDVKKFCKVDMRKEIIELNK